MSFNSGCNLFWRVRKKLQYQLYRLRSLKCIIYLIGIVTFGCTIPMLYPWLETVKVSPYVPYQIFPVNYIKARQALTYEIETTSLGKAPGLCPKANPHNLHGVLPVPASLSNAVLEDLEKDLSNGKNNLNSNLPSWLQKRNVSAREDGNGVEISEEEELRMRGIVGGFNARGSDKVRLSRKVPDSRTASCRRHTYNGTKFLNVSVIITACNEHFSILMRTVHSVLNYSPPNLLREIVLVIDYCAASPRIIEQEVNKIKLHVSNLPKVKLLVARKRLGVVTARLEGIAASSARIFVIMDAHAEVSTGWLEPLVYTLLSKSKTFVVPRTQVIDAQTYQHKINSQSYCTTGMSWFLEEKPFKPTPLEPRRYYSTSSSLVTTPIMPGSIFAVKRVDFEYFGKYDPKLRLSGAENLELSFRVWMCGGTIVCTPCSVVYRMFRSLGPVNYELDEQTVLRNKFRVMSGWMEKYADIPWNFLGRPELDYGDMSIYSEIQDDLPCNSFQWFLQNVWPESDIIELEQDMPYLGKIKNMKSKLCLNLFPNFADIPKFDIKFGDCATAPEFAYFAKTGQIRSLDYGEFCMEHTDVRRKYISFERCSSTEQIPSQAWNFKGTFNAVSNAFTRQCLSHNGTDLLSADRCEKSRKNQLWSWDVYKPSSKWTKRDGIAKKAA